MSSLRRWLGAPEPTLERIRANAEAFRVAVAEHDGAPLAFHVPPLRYVEYDREVIAADERRLIEDQIAADERRIVEDQIAFAREALRQPLQPAPFYVPPVPWPNEQAMFGHNVGQFPAEAEERAWELLREHLDAEQRKSLEKQKAFTVQGSRGGRYRIRVAGSYNVDELKDGEPHVRLCVVPSEPVPTGDQLLAQMLLLQADEARFWSIANQNPGDAWDWHGAEYFVDTAPWDRETVATLMKGRLEKRRAVQGDAAAAYDRFGVAARDAAEATRALTEAIDQATRHMNEDVARYAAMIDRLEG